MTRVAAPVALAGAVLAVSVVVHVRDPHQAGSYGFCPWLLLTGTFCPGCGGLRAVHDLTHGDVLAAASSNLLLVASLPFALLTWARWLVARVRHGGPVMSARTAVLTAYALAAVSLAFWLVRNLPGGEWLAP